MLTNVFFLQTNLPVFKIKESSVRRRYSDFEWLRSELERDSKVSINIDIVINKIVYCSVVHIIDCGSTATWKSN